MDKANIILFFSYANKLNNQTKTSNVLSISQYLAFSAYLIPAHLMSVFKTNV